MLFETRFYKHVLLTYGRVHFLNVRIFSKFRSCHFCTVFSTICGTVVAKVIEIYGFWDFLAHFEVQRDRHVWFEMRHKTAGFYHVLSVSVVPSMSVESAMESNDVLMTCLALCLRTAHIEVPSLAATQALSLPEHCRFSRTSHGCLPTFCDTRLSKVPAILRDWQEQDAERAVL